MKVDYIEHIDCFEGMKRIPDGTIDMVLCDLPYGVTRNTWDRTLDLSALWMEYKRIVKPHGAICLHADGMFMAKLMLSQPSMWRYNLVWDKVLTTGFLNASRMPLKRTEEVCVFYRKQPTYHPQMVRGTQNHKVGKSTGKTRNAASKGNANYGAHLIVDNSAKWGCMKHPTNLLRFAKTHPSKAYHPTEKPVALLEWLIKTYTNPGDVVLDNCMGSGSTAVAAINTGRHYIGFEVEKAFYEIAQQRIQNATNTKHTLFDFICQEESI